MELGARARPSLSSRLRGSAAWMVVPAAAMAVSLGVALPTPAKAAATALSTAASGVTLSNAGYAGATYFFLPSGNSITNGAGDAVNGPGPNTWTLINQGSIASTTKDGVYLFQGTVNNGGSYAGNAATSAAYIGGHINGVSIHNAGTINNVGTIAGVTQTGVYIAGLGVLTNTGLISGGSRGAWLNGGGVLTNRGTIKSVGAGSYGVKVSNGAGTIINYGSITGSAYGVSLAGGTVFNAGSATITGSGGFGVDLNSGGVVTNQGTISSYQVGVVIRGAPGTVTNSGSIYGETGFGVELAAGGSLTNSGAISSYQSGVIISGAAGALTNSGSIHGETDVGVDLVAGGSVTNSGNITGRLHGVLATNGSALVTNSGAIASYDGIYLVAGGQVTNDAGGTITASGSLKGAIFLKAAGTVINHAGGAIIGGYAPGVYLQAGGTVLNYGYMKGDYGIRSTATTANAAYLLNQGTVKGQTGVLFGSGTIANSGAIIGTAGYDAVLFSTDNDRLILQSGYSFTGKVDGGAGTDTLEVQTGTGTLSNLGTEFLNFEQVLVDAGATAANSGSASIATGVALTNSGTVSNAGTLTVSGVLLDQGLVTNVGSIAGQVQLAGGTFDNSGRISTASGAAVAGNSGNDTVINSGAIIGTGGTAVNFGAGNDRLILDAGYGFSGAADGGGGANTLEFQSGTATLSGLGSAFLNFQDVQLDPGASSVLVAGGTIAGGITLSNDGSIANTAGYTLAGVLTNAGTFVNSGSLNVTATFTNSSGGILINSGTIVGASGPGLDMTGGGTLTNTGLIQGAPYGLVAGAGDNITNSGTIADAGIAGVALGSAATFTNQAGGLLTGVTGAAFTGTGATLVNYGVITGTGGTAVQFDAGGNTLTLGTGSTLNGSIDGGGGASQIALVGSGTIANTIANFGPGSALAIAQGASWTVTGPITIASLTNSGTFTPGSAAAPLKVTGNFTQSSTGVFQTVLNSDGTANELQVTGSASLAGTVLVTPPAGVVLTQPIEYTILTASGGVGGAFSSVSGGTALVVPSLSYDTNDAFVTLTQGTLASLANATPNQAGAGSSFDAAIKANPALFGPTLVALDTLQAPQLAANLDRLAGENNADLSTVALFTGRQFIRQFQNHALTHGPDDHGGDIWASGFGQSGNVDGDANSHRLNEGSAGGAIGAETEAIPSLDLGLMLGYGVGHFDVKGGLGQGRIDYTEFALTGDYNAGPLYLTAIVGGMEGRGTSLRDVSVPGIAATARGKVSDRQLLGAVETGYRMDDSWGVNLTPFLGLNFGAVKEDSLTETGGGALDLSASSRSTASVQSELGARLSEDMSLGGLPLSTDVKLAWGHDFAGTARQAELSFAGGTDFLVSGARAPTDSAVIGLGLAARIWREGAITLHYDGDFAGRAQSNAISLGLRFNW